MNLTPDEIMALRPCTRYPESRVRALFAGRSSQTLQEILALDIPAPDRIWVACKLLPDILIRHWVADVLTLVLPVGERWAPGDSRLRNCVELSRRFADGTATQEDLTEARTQVDEFAESAWTANVQCSADAPACAAFAGFAVVDAVRLDTSDASWIEQALAYDPDVRISRTVMSIGYAAIALNVKPDNWEWPIERLSFYVSRGTT